MIFVNFKTYQSGTGENALRMAKVVEKVSRSTGIEMAVVVQAVDVYRISREVLVPVYVQHIDGIGYGAHTGWILPEAVKQAGAMGALINHSERKIENIKYQISNNKPQNHKGFGAQQIQNKTHPSSLREGPSQEGIDVAVERCKRVGLKTVVCGEDVDEVEKILELDPDFTAYEPPELIGSRDKSVASEKPEVVSKVIEVARQEKVLIGAGVHSVEDIRVGLELGAFGFLIATDVMKAKDPEKELRELVKGYNGMG